MAESTTTGRLKSFLLLIYSFLAAPSDEVKAAPPPSPAPPVSVSFVNVTTPNPRPSPAMMIAFAFAIPIAMWLVTFGRDELSRSVRSFVLIPVSLGPAAVLYGIQLRDALPKLARIVEAVGIALVSISFFTIIAFFLPPEASWVPIVCTGFSVLPAFALAVWQPQPPS